MTCMNCGSAAVRPDGWCGDCGRPPSAATAPPAAAWPPPEPAATPPLSWPPVPAAPGVAETSPQPWHTAGGRDRESWPAPAAPGSPAWQERTSPAPPAWPTEPTATEQAWASAPATHQGGQAWPSAPAQPWATPGATPPPAPAWATDATMAGPQQAWASPDAGPINQAPGGSSPYATAEAPAVGFPAAPGGTGYPAPGVLSTAGPVFAPGTGPGFPPAAPYGSPPPYLVGGQFPAAPAERVGSGFSIAAFVLAAIAVLVLPVVFGLLAIIFGAVAMRRGEPRGRLALILAVAGTVVGFALGVLVGRM